MYKYKEYNYDKALKEINFLKLMGDIFSLMFVFSLFRAFLISDTYAAFNSLIFLGLYIHCSIKQEILEQRTDFYLSKQ